MPPSQSVQQQIGQNNSNSLVPHSQSAYEIGQVSQMTHQQALHQQLQQRFASANNSNSGMHFDYHFELRTITFLICSKGITIFVALTKFIIIQIHFRITLCYNEQ